MSKVSVEPEKNSAMLNRIFDELSKKHKGVIARISEEITLRVREDPVLMEAIVEDFVHCMVAGRARLHASSERSKVLAIIRSASKPVPTGLHGMGKDEVIARQNASDKRLREAIPSFRICGGKFLSDCTRADLNEDVAILLKKEGGHARHRKLVEAILTIPALKGSKTVKQVTLPPAVIEMIKSIVADE